MTEPTLGIVVSDDLLDALAERLQGRVEQKQVYTTEALADHLGVSARYVRGMGQRGCPRHRVGKAHMWLLDEVTEWIRER